MRSNKLHEIVALCFLVLTATAFLITQEIYAIPKVMDEKLHVREIVNGLRYPTTITFLKSGDMLIAEKDNGTVMRFSDGQLIPTPIVDLNVSNGEGRGLLGIASINTSNETYVILSYLATAKGKDFDDFSNGSYPSGNLLTRFQLVNDSLVSPKVLRNISAIPGPFHYGGTVIVGPDGYLYHVIGDNGPTGERSGKETLAKNIPDGSVPDGTSGIVKIDINGSGPPNGILSDRYPLNTYYAYGIRNSFGLAFDPVTGILWDTENGPDFGDEINIVDPGFNSGWSVVMGIPDKADLARQAFDPILGIYEEDARLMSYPLDLLEDFNGTGKYADPVFVWQRPVGVTALAFLNSTLLGNEYYNDLFVGDINNGRVYHFDLTPDRRGLILNGPLADKIADDDSELEGSIFASGFAGVSDIKVGPDGFLYVVSHFDGKIYRIEHLN